MVADYSAPAKASKANLKKANLIFKHHTLAYFALDDNLKSPQISKLSLKILYQLLTRWCFFRLEFLSIKARLTRLKLEYSLSKTQGLL